MIKTRDVELGALLDELEVCEHGEEYWEALLAEAEPELERLRGQAGQKAERLPVALDACWLRRRRKAVWLAAAAVAAAAALAIVLLAGLPGGHEGPAVFGPQPATAAEAIPLRSWRARRRSGPAGDLVRREGPRRRVRRRKTKSPSSAREMGATASPRGPLGKDALFPLPGYVETTAYDAPTRVTQGLLRLRPAGVQL